MIPDSFIVDCEEQYTSPCFVSHEPTFSTHLCMPHSFFDKLRFICANVYSSLLETNNGCQNSFHPLQSIGGSWAKERRGCADYRLTIANNYP